MISYATFGRRVWGFVFDAVIDIIVISAMSTVVASDRLAGVAVLWYVIHHVGFMTEGGSLGMRLAGLRVVRADTGERVSVLYAFIREIARIVSFIPLGLGVLWMLDQPQRRTWHDLLGGTIVVLESGAAPAELPAWAENPPWRDDARKTQEPPPPAEVR